VVLSHIHAWHSAVKKKWPTPQDNGHVSADELNGFGRDLVQILSIAGKYSSICKRLGRNSKESRGKDKQQ
jgi:hypothetical protein